MVKLMNRFMMVVLVFLVFVFTVSFYSFAEAAATLKLSPDKETVTKDTLFNVAILVSTGGEAVNFVSANLDWPKDKLRVDSFDENQTFITIWPEKSYNNELGRVELAGALYNPGITGNDLRFITIRFKAIGNAADSASVTFRDSSEVYRLSDTTNILGTKSSGVYTISGVAVTPVPIASTGPSASPSATTAPSKQPEQPSPATATATLMPSPPVGGELPKTGQFTTTIAILIVGSLITVGGFSLRARS